MKKEIWATPTTMDSLPPKSEKALLHEALEVRPGRTKPSNLRDQVSNMRLWPTPVRSDCKGGVSDECFFAKEEKGQRTRMSFLKDAVLHTYPTPGTTGLANGSGNCEKANRLYEAGVITEEERRSFRAGNGGQLNPDWVEIYLMGWPPGWTRLEPINKELYYEWERLFRTSVISFGREEAGSENVQKSEAEMRDMRDSMQKVSCEAAWNGEGCNGRQNKSLPNLRKGVYPESESREILQSTLCADSKLEEKRDETPDNLSCVWKGVFSDEIASKHMLSFMREQASMAEQNARQLREEFKRWQEMGYETLASRYWMPDPADIGLIPRVTKVKTFRRERLMALGNGQVPSCVCLAETILREAAV